MSKEGRDIRRLILRGNLNDIRKAFEELQIEDFKNGKHLALAVEITNAYQRYIGKTK